MTMRCMQIVQLASFMSWILPKFPLKICQPVHVVREPQSAEQSCEMKAEECNVKLCRAQADLRVSLFSYEDPVAFLPSPGLLPGPGSTYQDIWKVTARATFSRSLGCNQAKGGRWRSLGEALLHDCVGETRFVSAAEGWGESRFILVFSQQQSACTQRLQSTPSFFYQTHGVCQKGPCLATLYMQSPARVSSK